MANKPTAAQLRQQENRSTDGKYQTRRSQESAGSPTMLARSPEIWGHMERAGFNLPVRPANRSEEVEYLVDRTQHVYETPGGRKIMLGDDWDGDKAAALRPQGRFNDEITATAYSGQADSARWVLRDCIAAEALDAQFGAGSTEMYDPFAIPLGQNDTGDDDGARVGFAALVDGEIWTIHHDYRDGTTSVAPPTSITSIEHDDLRSIRLLAKLTGAPHGDATDAEEAWRQSFRAVGVKMLNDKDVDPELTASLRAGS